MPFQSPNQKTIVSEGGFGIELAPFGKLAPKWKMGQALVLLAEVLELIELMELVGLMDLMELMEPVELMKLVGLKELAVMMDSIELMRLAELGKQVGSVDQIAVLVRLHEKELPCEMTALVHPPVLHG